jgi:allene oxide cyclase
MPDKQAREEVMLIVKSSLAVAFALGLGFSAQPAAAGISITLNLVERATTDAVTKTGKGDDNAGDLLTFANEVFDEANQNKVGSSTGWCIRTVVGQSWECSWTLKLSDGQITVAGPFLDKSDSVLAIVGGTGAYVGARGEMALHARNPEGTEFDFRYSIMQ